MDSTKREDFMMKRSVNKSRITAQNYKSRWFILDNDTLSYKDGTLEKKGKVKGSIKLEKIKVVEAVEDRTLDNKVNVFQVVYGEGAEFFTLYIVALKDDQRKEWIEILRDAAGKKHACFFPKYHPGVWTKSLGRYSCCDQIDRNAVGCSLTTPEKDDATVPSVSKQQSVINKPLPPKPEDNNQSRDKKFYIAIYNFTPVEDGDLELQQGEEYEVVDDTRDHWWLAQNKAGLQGYIPANYIKKKFDLEIFDWFCKSYSRERSEQVLRKEGREGCFLVRESSTPGMFTLSLYTSERPRSSIMSKFSDGTVKHYHIKKNTEGMFYIAEKHAFPSVQDLVHYHKHDSAGLSTRLRSPPAPEGGKTAPATAGFGHSKYEIDPTEIVIEQQLGAGCFGTVNQGKWKGKVVAVKMMKEGTMSEDSFIEEARTMTQLNHPNLVQLYGIVTKRRPLIIVTELMPYGSLLTYLRRHKARLMPKTATLLDICSQVCNGMAYLEKRKFIHRDLAARNCLVGESMVVKVADFGLARYVLDDEYTSSQGTKFPVKWAPPEVLNFTRFSSKSDVWAFGVLMWETFTGGQMPYDKMKNVDVVDYVCQSRRRLEQPQSCPEKVYQVMMKCFNHDAEGRPSFQDLLQTLGGLMERGNYPFIGPV
ncbi:tyrosine-protein kinase Tec-like isoform X1 [Mytilus galloprovincialis]|uniref:tyrosine-protein kinase Tec-like isoform X1 n=1 Tax=Mytilus galloprovincialis TaxID=29158 RepID=UPI003F7C260D